MVPEQRDRPTQRIADVRLRGASARVYWPAPAGSAPDLPPLLVQFGDGQAWPGAVVLATRAPGLEPALRVVEWAADHADELGADPSRVLLTGAPELLAAVHSAARERGWPPVELLSPGTDEFRRARSSQLQTMSRTQPQPRHPQ